MTLKVFLVGEGPNDIGRWEETDPNYRETKTGDGVLGELARRQVESGWQIHGGCPWRRLPVLKVASGLNDGERKRFAGALQRTREAGCDVLIYGRDTDGYADRQAVLRDFARLRQDQKDTPAAVAVVHPCIEGWVLELRGERKKNGWSKVGAQAALGPCTTAQMEEVVAAWDPNATPHLSEDLKQWLDDVERVLGSPEEP